MISRTFAIISTIVWTTLAMTQTHAAPPPPSPESVLDSLVKTHPRLYLDDARLAELKKRCASDTVLQRYVSDSIKGADRDLAKPALKHELHGPRLLHVSRDCLGRVVALALAYRWTGDEKYARAAVENMKTVAAFPDWNPSHFLDVAEMTAALGIGYDWLYPYMDEATRQTIRTGIVELGLKQGLKVYKSGGWWVKGENNWNEVCNGGMLVGALAIADTDPEWARRIVPAAVKSLPHALASYAPDGAWMEGPGYWHYASRYTAFGLGAMDSCLGTTFGLADMPGLAVTGLFPVYMNGPTGRYLTFADAGMGKRGALACQFWFARKYGNTFISDSEHHYLEKAGANPWHVAYYAPPSGRAFSPPDNDRFFDGKVPVAVLRSAWGDARAMWVGVKAGYNQVPHGHLDLGNFELDALGVRWAIDLGADNYNMPGYWQGKRGGKRWTYYRLNSLSHNVPCLGGRMQDPLGAAKVVRFESGDLGGFFIVDISSAYAPFGRKVVRGVRMMPGRRSVLVQDEFKLLEPLEVAWGMTTDAKIEVDGSRAVLSKALEKLELRVLEPAGATISVESAEQEKPQAANHGFRRLMVKHTPDSLETRVAVLMRPLPAGAEALEEAPKVEALENWQGEATTGALLESIRVDGKALEGFAPRQFTYHLTLPKGSKAMPKIEARAASGEARVRASGESLPGVVDIALVDGATGHERVAYKVYCREDKSAGEGLGEYQPARDGIRVAASSYDGNMPSNTLDGDLATRWSADGIPQTIQYDLGRVRKVSSVSISWFMGDRRFGFFEIHVSEDGKEWRQVYDGKSSGLTTKLEGYEIGRVNARYVRIVGKGNSQSQWNSIQEVEFGSD